MSDRLRRHGVRWRMARLGWPIYSDEWPYEQIGVVTEDEWKWDDLTPEEQSKLNDDAALLAIESGERTPDSPITFDFAMGYTLSDSGIACFHRWSFQNDPRGVPFYRECGMCGVYEPLPGRVYRVGDGWMRLSDPPPRKVCLPRPQEVSVMADTSDPLGECMVLVDEYRWNGHHYVLEGS